MNHFISSEETMTVFGRNLPPPIHLLLASTATKLEQKPSELVIFSYFINLFVLKMSTIVDLRWSS